MGCTSSSPANAEDLNATERVMNGRKGIDKTERIHTASERAKLAKRVQAPKDDVELPPPKLNENGQLMAEEVVKRISGSVEAKEIVLGDIRSGKADDLIHVQYAVMTQRGYYPDSESFYVYLSLYHTLSYLCVSPPVLITSRDALFSAHRTHCCITCRYKMI